MAKKRIYRISFVSQGQIYEIFARGVSQGELFGFIQVEEMVFGERTQVVVDPSEERLKAEFDGVKRFYLPMHSILRIDEVEKEGPARIQEQKEGGKVTAFPVPLYPPPGGTTGKS